MRIIPRYNLESKDARRRLRVRPNPYWTMTTYGRHIGYLKTGNRRSFWVARFRTQAESYRRHLLAATDDWHPANGDNVLGYEQAWTAARQWFLRPENLSIATEEKRRGGNLNLNVCPIGSVFTVAHALHDYVEWKRLNATPQNFQSLVSLINFHLLPRLAMLPVEEFTVEVAQRLTRAILETAPRKGNQPQGPSIPIDRLDADHLRKRKQTTNAVLSILRVAFLQAWENGKVSSERPWRCIRRFRNVEAPRVLHLSRAECKRLLENCRPDLRRLVLGALYTGCRITELLRMRCSDVGRDGYGVFVSPIKSHRARFVFLPDEGMAWFLDLIKGRHPDEFLFMNDKTGRIFSRFKHLLKEAVRNAGLPFGFSFHGLRHTYASQLVQAGTPIMVVSEQLGHIHALTVLKTYGHLTPQIRESEVRQRFTPI